MKKFLKAVDNAESKIATDSSDMKKFLNVVTEGKGPGNKLTSAENMVYMNTPKLKKVSLNETPGLFKTYLKLVEEEDINQEDNLKTKLSDLLSEVKSQEPPKPRNFVAKNAPTTGAGRHKDSSKKKDQEQGKVKHKKDLVPMDESDQLDEKAVSKAQQKFMGMVHAAKKGEKAASPEVAKVAKGMSSKAAKDFASTKHKGLPAKKDTKTDEGVAGPKSCWPGHRKVGTKPGTGKNAGKRVNDCEKIKKESKSPVNEGDE